MIAGPESQPCELGQLAVGTIKVNFSRGTTKKVYEKLNLLRIEYFNYS